MVARLRGTMVKIELQRMEVLTGPENRPKTVFSQKMGRPNPAAAETALTTFALAPASTIRAKM